jgi:hypothetical protein
VADESVLNVGHRKKKSKKSTFMVWCYLYGKIKPIDENKAAAEVEILYKKVVKLWNLPARTSKSQPLNRYHGK